MSRLISDCIVDLQDAWHNASKKYREAYPNDPQPILTDTYRPIEEQNKIYAIGRTVKGKILTYAKGGESPHNFYPSFAFDIAFLGIDKKLYWQNVYFERFAEIIKVYSDKVKWGGDFVSFKDRPHFELKNWKDLSK